MAILPYMNQLPQDFYNFQYAATYAPEAPAPTPISTTPSDTVPAPTPFVPPPVPPSIVDVNGNPLTNEGGVWYGDFPPTDPGIGWCWLETVSNTMYFWDVSGKWISVVDGGTA